MANLIYAYHGYHCLSKDVEALGFKAIPPCESANCTTRKPNSTCQPDGYKGRHKCICNDEFFDEGNKCINKMPCQRNSCRRNQKCTPIVATGGRNCTCEKNFIEINGTCEPVSPDNDPCRTNPCVRNQKCERIEGTGGYNCTCENNVNEENGTCEPIPPDTGYDLVKDDNNGVIVAAVLIPTLVILIAICIIGWLCKRHERRMDFMEKEMEIAFDFGRRSNRQRPQAILNILNIDQDTLEDDNSERIENLIYVSQDKGYEIPGYIAEKICSLEMPASSIRFGGIIGRGAFGKVYVGEAQGINRNPEWTTVAIKTRTESANEEELNDILGEIELMKDLGKHENVIQMFGCSTRCRTICLVLEYAPGGNLKDYLRSLKKKAEYQELVEAGEIPNDSTSSIPVNASEWDKLEEIGLKQTEDLNSEITTRINEEILDALDPKVLETFARQIATGMKHVSGLGIVHRDLAARNILLGEDRVLKISDFGLSREGTYIQISNGKIPFRWLSIEAIQERTYSTASDVWAFGVVLWEICTLGDTPYTSVSNWDLEDFLLAGKRLEKVDSCTDDIYKIMLKCWSHLPKDRPKFAELSDKLWDLEHKENTYVNLDSLMQQSMQSEDGDP